MYVKADHVKMWYQRKAFHSFVKYLVGFWLLVGIGMLFSVYQLGYDGTDGFYFAIITGTSVGLGDITVRTDVNGDTSLAGTWFGIFYVFVFFIFIVLSLSRCVITSRATREAEGKPFPGAAEDDPRHPRCCLTSPCCCSRRPTACRRLSTSARRGVMSI